MKNQEIPDCTLMLYRLNSLVIDLLPLLPLTLLQSRPAMQHDDVHNGLKQSYVPMEAPGAGLAHVRIDERD